MNLRPTGIDATGPQYTTLFSKVELIVRRMRPVNQGNGKVHLFAIDKLRHGDTIEQVVKAI